MVFEGQKYFNFVVDLFLKYSILYVVLIKKDYMDSNTTNEQRAPDNSEQTSFGWHLNNLIEISGMNQKEFSEKAQTAQPTVSAIIHGRQQIGMKLAEKFATALNLDESDKARFMMLAKKPRWKGMGHASDGPEAMLNEAIMAIILAECKVKPQSIASVLRVQQIAAGPDGKRRPDIVLLLKDGQTVDIEVKANKRPIGL